VEFGKLYLCPVIKLSFGYRPSTAFASVKQTITVYHMVVRGTVFSFIRVSRTLVYSETNNTIDRTFEVEHFKSAGNNLIGNINPKGNV